MLQSDRLILLGDASTHRQAVKKVCSLLCPIIISSFPTVAVSSAVLHPGSYISPQASLASSHSFHLMLSYYLHSSILPV